MPFYVGLDLGQAADYTALAVVQGGIRESPETGDAEKYLHLRHLERYKLRTPYPEIADNVAALMRDPLLSPNEHDPSRARLFKSEPRLIVDSTGVGVAVSDLLKARGLKFEPVTITAGDRTHRANGTWRVPKRDLVAALEVPFHTGELKIAKGLELAPTLRKQLLNFRRKINLHTAHDSYEHWREGDHDDLVLAAALACWWPRRLRRGSTHLRVYR